METNISTVMVLVSIWTIEVLSCLFTERNSTSTISIPRQCKFIMAACRQPQIPGLRIKVPARYPQPNITTTFETPCVYFRNEQILLIFSKITGKYCPVTSFYVNKSHRFLQVHYYTLWDIVIAFQNFKSRPIELLNNRVLQISTFLND